MKVDSQNNYMVESWLSGKFKLRADQIKKFVFYLYKTKEKELPIRDDREHGVSRCESVENNLHKMLSGELHKKLSEPERFILTIAAWTHDIGSRRGIGNDDDRLSDSDIISSYHIRSEYYIVNNYLLLGIHEEESVAFGLLARFHHLNCNLSDCPQSLTVPRFENVRLRLLAAYLRTAVFFYPHHIYPTESREELSILLSSEMTMRHFLAKITSIEEIYNIICLILEIQLSKYPLLINKIESGSLWAKLSGHEKVIGLMVVFISSSASYMYRNFTEEGRFSSIPEEVKVIESVLNLSKELKAAGVNTVKLNKHIEISAVTLAKNLNILLKGEAEVSVNNRSISIGNEMNKQLIGDSSCLKIKYDQIDQVLSKKKNH